MTAGVGRSTRGGVVGLVLACAACALACGSAAAQEVTLTAGRSGSDYREFDASLGWGADISFLTTRAVGIRVGVRRHSDDGAWVRSTCVGLIPPDSEICRQDRFEGSYSWLSAGIGPELRLAVGERFGITAATLISRIWIDGSWRGRESGLSLGRPPDGSVLGLTALGGVTWSIDRRWGLTALGRIDDPQFTQCVSDTYDPFCDGGALRTFELGVIVRR